MKITVVIVVIFVVVWVAFLIIKADYKKDGENERDCNDMQGNQSNMEE